MYELDEAMKETLVQLTTRLGAESKSINSQLESVLSSLKTNQEAAAANLKSDIQRLVGTMSPQQPGTSNGSHLTHK